MATPRALLVLVLLAWSLESQSWAQGRGFGFSPTQLYLSSKTASAALTLKNQDKRTFRFQVTANVWAQDSKGVMQLTPTEEIVFFPRLFSLEPGKERIVRVGASAKPGAAEKTYRLMVEELPELTKPEEDGRGAQISVRTRLAIPIFLQPDRIVLKGQVDALGAKGRHLLFQIRNSGNIHFQVKGIVVKGVGAAGETVFEKKLDGWYVLPAGTREYDIELARADCIRAKKVTIEATHERGTFVGQMELPAAACND